LYLQKKDNLIFFIAPHLIDDAHINELMLKFGDTQIRYSAISYQTSDLRPQTSSSADIFKDKRVLIIDSIGILAQLYKYCDIAYIGGGFGSGIHNILEAAVFGKPVIFGPKYQKFQEAKDLIQLEGAFSIKEEKEFKNIVERLIDNDLYRIKVSEICKNYVKQKTGATDHILNVLMC
jgi:3-deoxy-D-manno-octulosonic-acid transferase